MVQNGFKDMGDLPPSTKNDATGSKLGYYLSTFESVMNTWTPTEAADAMTLDYIFVQAKQMKIQLEKFLFFAYACKYAECRNFFLKLMSV